jgi:hypothetical protein
VISENQLAVIKTTDEEVFVVKISDENRFSATRQTALVRRPTVGRDGIVHHLDEFFVEELYSKDEQFEAKLKEQISRAEKANKFRIPPSIISPEGVEALN